MWLDAQIGHQDKSAEKGQKTAILIEVPVSGRLGYLTTTDAWVHYSFLRIIKTQRKGPRRSPSPRATRIAVWYPVDRIPTGEIITPTDVNVIIL